MKHKLISYRSGHIHCDVLDDQGNVIVGGLMLPVDKSIADLDQYFTDVVYPMVLDMITPEAEKDTSTIETSPVLERIEISKEKITYVMIEFVRNNQKAFLSDLISHVEQSFGWEDSSLLLKIMAEYVRECEQKNLIPCSKEERTKEETFAALQKYILETGAKDVEEMLK